MLKNTANLLNLQNLMKRDPQSYLEEFRQQQRHFMANLQIFQSSLLASGGTSAAGGTASTGAASVAPSALGQQSGTSGAKQHKFHKDFGGLVTFLAHVSPCFKVESSLYSSQLLSLLTSHYEILDPPLRKTIVQAVILLQNRGLLDRMTLLPILFQLFKIQDKPLRLLLFHHIISDIKRINLKKVPGYLRINSQLQNYMYTMLSDKTSPIAAKKSLDVMIDLWRRKIWNDEKTVHAIQAATFSKDTRIKVTALRFFLGMTFYDEEEEEEEEEEKATIRAKLSVQKTALKGVTKKRKKAEREMKRATKKINKEDGKGNSGSSVRDDCPAILLLHDPQTYAERLFTMVKNSNESFQVRMLIMNVISRLIGAHRLIVLNFYPFLQKYMQPHQKNVTHILTYLAQATHPHVPPDVLQPCVRTLANHFVNDRSSPEVTAVGLNAIREICARAPLVMDSELLWDLVAYKKDKNKGVMMASRSLIALFRDINPLLLKRKERGKHASEFDETEVEFGFEKVRTDIVGADLLQQINETKQDDAGQVGRKGYRALLGDEWEIDDGDSDEDEDEDLGTSTKEVNNFLRMMEESDDDEPEGDRKVSVKKSNKKLTKKAQAKIATAARRAAKEEAKKAAAKDGKAASAEESDEEMEDGEEASDDDEEGEEDDEDGEEMDFDLEDGERIEGSGSENDEDDDDDDDDEEEEEEEEKSSSNASKKRKTSMGAVTTATETAEEAAEADGEEESKEPAKPALPYGATHIFTPRDFEALKAARLQSALNPKKRQPHKREDGTTLLASSAYFDMEEGEDEDGNRVVQRQRRDTVGDVVDEMAIVGYRKQKHRTKEERLAAVHASRMDGINTKKKGGGSTNYDKEKNKPFVLTKHSDSVRRKKQRSFSQQQQAFSGHLKNMKHMTKKAKKQLKRHKSSKMAGKA